jgi:hypothetical protein
MSSTKPGRITATRMPPGSAVSAAASSLAPSCPLTPLAGGCASVSGISAKPVKPGIPTDDTLTRIRGPFATARIAGVMRRMP